MESGASFFSCYGQTAKLVLACQPLGREGRLGPTAVGMIIGGSGVYGVY